MTLTKKLAEVMQAVERIPKRGRNDFHKYDYATEADIVSVVRKELSERHVMLFPSIVGETRHVVGEKGSVLTVLEMEMEFMDGESGETLKKPWRGYGTDKEDKGGYKAMTGGEKYFLLKTFLIPTGDDPEATDGEGNRTTGKKPLVVKPKATPKPESAPEGGVFVMAVESKPNGQFLYAKVVLSDGREVIARDEGKDKNLVALLEQVAQDQTPVEITTRRVKARGGRDDYDLIEEIVRLPRVPLPANELPALPQEGPF